MIAQHQSQLARMEHDLLASLSELQTASTLASDKAAECEQLRIQISQQPSVKPIAVRQGELLIESVLDDLPISSTAHSRADEHVGALRSSEQAREQLQATVEKQQRELELWSQASDSDLPKVIAYLRPQIEMSPCCPPKGQQ